MREVGMAVGQFTVPGVLAFKRYKKPALSVLAVAGILLALTALRAFVQPASAMTADAAMPIDGLYGSDEIAYYCSRFGLRSSRVPSVCQSPELAAGEIAAQMMPAAVVNGGNCRTYDALFRQYNWNVAVAEAICQAESRGNPTAVSRTNDYGLMQLHNMKIFDPAENIAAAYKKYQSQGWQAWTTYTSGAYVRFL